MVTGGGCIERVLLKWSKVADGGSGSLTTGLEVIFGGLVMGFTFFVTVLMVAAAAIFWSSSANPIHKAMSADEDLDLWRGSAISSSELLLRRVAIVPPQEGNWSSR